MTATLSVPTATSTPAVAWLPRLLLGIVRLHRTGLLSIALIYLAFTAMALDVVHQVGHPRTVIYANEVFNSRLYFLAEYAVYLPILVAVFIGAPLLARSIETGTYRFAWTQSIGRRRLVATTLAVYVAELTALSILLGFALSRLSYVLSPQFGDVWQDRVFFASPWMLAVSSVIGLLVGVLLGLVIRRVLPALAATTAVIITLVDTTWTVLYPGTLNWVATRMPPTFVLPASVKGQFSVAYENTISSLYYTDRFGHELSSGQFYTNVYTHLTVAQQKFWNAHQDLELHRLGYHWWSAVLFHAKFHEVLMTWLGFGGLAIIVLFASVFFGVGGNDLLLLRRKHRWPKEWRTTTAL